MAKKLKKKIEELCGLAGLKWEERQVKAEQILASSEWKQRLCNELIGLSFRELEQTLTGIANEREKREDSYERKLEAYRDGSSPKRPSSTSDRGPKSNTKTGNVQREAPRTLEQILAQVYAPRESPEVFKRGERGHLALFQESSAEEVQDLLPGPYDEDSVSD